MHIRTIVLLALILASSPISALDLGAEFQTGNLFFSRDRVSTDLAYPGSVFDWGVSAFVSQPVNSLIRIEGGVQYDPLLHYAAHASFIYSDDMLTLRLGPFFGLFNDLSTPLSPGISVGVKLQIPGAFFLSIRTDSSISNLFLKAGDCLLDLTDVSIGFYVRNAICTVSYSTRSVTCNLGSSLTIDALTKYFFRTELYQKNVPFRISVDLGYQTLTKQFSSGSLLTASDIVNSVFASPEIDLLFRGGFVFYTVFEGSIFTFGQGQLLGVPAGSFLFRVFSGFRLSAGDSSK